MSGKFLSVSDQPAAVSQIRRHISGYLDHLLIERGLSKNSMSAYRRDLARYADYLEGSGKLSFAQVLPEQVSDFLVALRLGDSNHQALARHQRLEQ